jgi:hypothetical protein
VDLELTKLEMTEDIKTYCKNNFSVKLETGEEKKMTLSLLEDHHSKFKGHSEHQRYQEMIDCIYYLF